MSNIKKAKEALQSEFEAAVLNEVVCLLKRKEQVEDKIKTLNKELYDIGINLINLDTATLTTHIVFEEYSVGNNKYKRVVERK